MDRNEIVEYLNAEIARLTSARDLMTGQDAEAPRRRGRPKGSTNKAVSFNPEDVVKPERRTMSPEGKARIVAAQKKRRAAEKSASTKKATPSKTSASRKSAPVAKKTAVKAAPKPALKAAIAKKAAAKKAPALAKAVAPAKDRIVTEQ